MLEGKKGSLLRSGLRLSRQNRVGETTHTFNDISWNDSYVIYKTAGNLSLLFPIRCGLISKSIMCGTKKDWSSSRMWQVYLIQGNYGTAVTVVFSLPWFSSPVYRYVHTNVDIIYICITIAFTCRNNYNIPTSVVWSLSWFVELQPVIF